jgi:hypothetical protein
VAEDGASIAPPRRCSSIDEVDIVLVRVAPLPGRESQTALEELHDPPAAATLPLDELPEVDGAGELEPRHDREATRGDVGARRGARGERRDGATPEGLSERWEIVGEHVEQQKHDRETG